MNNLINPTIAQRLYDAIAISHREDRTAILRDMDIDATESVLMDMAYIDVDGAEIVHDMESDGPALDAWGSTAIDGHTWHLLIVGA